VYFAKPNLPRGLKILFTRLLFLFFDFASEDETTENFSSVGLSPNTGLVRFGKLLLVKMPLSELGVEKSDGKGEESGVKEVEEIEVGDDDEELFSGDWDVNCHHLFFFRSLFCFPSLIFCLSWSSPFLLLCSVNGD